MRVLLRLLGGLALVLIILAGAAFGAWRALDAPMGGGVASDSVLFSVIRGESAHSIGVRLAAEGLIHSSLVWDLLSRIDGRSLKVGQYSLSLTMSTSQIRELLISGKQELIRVTIPEGYTLKKIAKTLEDENICDASEFLEMAKDSGLLTLYGIQGPSFEGFLYPDTYLFPQEYPAEKVIASMADTFYRRLDQIYPEWKTLSSEELFTRIVVASIIEREYRSDDEAPLMASVFFNRLRIGMRLQSCATVVYVITEVQGKQHPEVLYNRDIEIQDPYNTYVHRGLPPGPISAPGAVALSAAFFPADTDYLYFRVVDPSAGRHHFSKTLDEHNQAGVIYLKAVAGKK